MKAEIDDLWGCGELIVAGISSIEKLSECENVLVGKKDARGYEVLIDDNIYHCRICKRHHPADASKEYVCFLY